MDFMLWWWFGNRRVWEARGDGDGDGDGDGVVVRAIACCCWVRTGRTRRGG